VRKGRLLSSHRQWRLRQSLRKLLPGLESLIFTSPFTSINHKVTTTTTTTTTITIIIIIIIIIIITTIIIITSVI